MFDTGPLNDAMIDNDVFGQAATILPAAGGSIPLQIVWDIQPEYEGDGDYEVGRLNYVAGCREEDVSTVQKDDVLVVNGKNYNILMPVPDGHGWVNLIVEPE